MTHTSGMRVINVADRQILFYQILNETICQLQYCQEITWHCVCRRFASTLRPFCVHPAGVLRPLCGHPASTLRAFCVHSARGYSASCVQPKLRLLGRTRTDHHKILIQHIGQFTNVKKFRTKHFTFYVYSYCDQVEYFLVINMATLRICRNHSLYWQQIQQIHVVFMYSQY